MRSISGIVLVTFVMISTTVAAEQAEKEARAQFELGVELYDEGKYDQAAIAFARAYELKPSFKLLYNIAQTENQLGRYAAALEAYRRYTEEGAGKLDKKRSAEVAAEIERLAALVGAITVTGEQDGAQVFIDSRAVGETPLDGPVMVDLGEHEVLVKYEGVEVHKEIVKVAGGSESAVHWKKPVTAKEGRPVDGGSESGKKRIWTWVALGAAGAAGIAGGVLGGVALSSKKDIEAECVDGQCPPARKDDGEKVANLALGADILYGVAGAAAVAAIVLFFVEPKMGESNEEPVVAAPLVGPGTAGIGVMGRF